jgi:uncharacterized protein (TIGR03067 family)
MHQALAPTANLSMTRSSRGNQALIIPTVAQNVNLLSRRLAVGKARVTLGRGHCLILNEIESMKNPTHIVQIALAAALLAAAGCATSPKPASATAAATVQKPDLAALQGTWKFNESANNTPVPVYLVIYSNNLEFRGAEGNEWYKGTFTLMEGTNPRRLDLTVTECFDPQYVGRLAHAIYQFEDGGVRIAGHGPGNPDIPATFDAPGARQGLFKKM